MSEVNIGTYHHGKNDNLFHDGVKSHKAQIVNTQDDGTCDLVILDAEGNPTIPVRNVPNKSNKKRDKDAAYWE